MYVTEDLARFPLFKGGFINFGYWRPGSKPTARERIAASRELYLRVLKAARLGPSSELLEVGCGRGYGCALAKRTYGTRRVVGVDLFPAQVRRARRLHPGIEFKAGAAEKLPFADRTFDRVVSLEAAQHFRSLPRFFREAHRVLRPGGRLVVCTFFATRSSALARLRSMLPTVADGIDRVVPLAQAKSAASAAGFRVSERSIGARVFPGWNGWIERCGLEQSWSKLWLEAWKLGLLDYHLLTAVR